MPDLLQLADGFFKFGRRITRDSAVQEATAHVRCFLALRVSASCDHSMTKSIPDLTDAFQFVRDRSSFQPVFKPAPSEEQVPNKRHQSLEVWHCRQRWTLRVIA